MSAGTFPRPRACLVACLILAVPACQRNAPDESDGSRVLRHQLAAQGDDLIRLIAFTKTGGQRSTLLGVSWYTMQFGAQIEFLSEACYGGGLSARPYVAPRFDRSGLPASDDSAAACHRIHVSKGERREVTGSLPFELVRGGRWRGPDLRLY